ncbi:MAG TPA: hypothetical protein DD791_07770 [Syntrophomonas sp.]|nr:hypothetical protein [Syntrophomonas sp.]
MLLPVGVPGEGSLLHRIVLFSGRYIEFFHRIEYVLMFITQAVIDAPGSMLLFNWPVQVFFKPGINYRFYRIKFRRSCPFRFSDFMEIGWFSIFFSNLLMATKFINFRKCSIINSKKRDWSIMIAAAQAKLNNY